VEDDDDDDDDEDNDGWLLVKRTGPDGMRGNADDADEAVIISLKRAAEEKKHSTQMQNICENNIQRK